MDVPQPALPRSITVSSPAFAEGATIPARFTCHGAGPSPAFRWTGVPTGAASLAVVVSDPDAPGGTYLHWLVTGLDARDGAFAEGGAPEGAHEWPSSARMPRWVPPCPPSGTHHYIVAVYALDAPVDGRTSQQVLDAIGRHVVAWGTLTGVVRAH